MRCFLFVTIFSKFQTGVTQCIYGSVDCISARDEVQQEGILSKFGVFIPTRLTNPGLWLFIEAVAKVTLCAAFVRYPLPLFEGLRISSRLSFYISSHDIDEVVEAPCVT